MKKILLLVALVLTLLIPTGAGFAEREDFPRICVEESQM